MAFIVVVCTQVDRVAFTAALRHSKHVDEEAEALLRFRREQLQMTQMSQIHDRFVLHGVTSTRVVTGLCPVPAEQSPATSIVPRTTAPSCAIPHQEVKYAQRYL